RRRRTYPVRDPSLAESARGGRIPLRAQAHQILKFFHKCLSRGEHQPGSDLMSRDTALVSVDWAEKNLDTPGVVFVEVDADTTAHDAGHFPGAIKLNWKTDLQDPVRLDALSKEQFESLLSERGISEGDTVILYGGNNNWFAAYAYWYFKLYGHRDVR